LDPLDPLDKPKKRINFQQIYTEHKDYFKNLQSNTHTMEGYEEQHLIDYEKRRNELSNQHIKELTLKNCLKNLQEDHKNMEKEYFNEKDRMKDTN